MKLVIVTWCESMRGEGLREKKGMEKYGISKNEYTQFSSIALTTIMLLSVFIGAPTAENVSKMMGDVGLSHAILSTNETGEWENKTIYAFNSNSLWSNFTWQNASVPEGSVVGWRIYANDTSSNWNVTEIMAFTVEDMTPLRVIFVPPTPANNSEITVDYVFLNVSVNENASVALLNWNGIDITMNGSGMNFYLDMTNLSNGNYTYSAYANDTAGNIGVSETRKVFVNVTTPQDTTPPLCITNLSHISRQTWINWTWSNPEDGDFDFAMVYINGTWQANTSDFYYNTTGLVPNASYEIGIRTVNMNGNINETWVNDTAFTLPLAFFVSIISPFEGQVFEQNETSAKIIIVPDDYPTIQQAVDNASDGDSIFVRNGTYPENIRIDNKDLTFEGEDRDTTIIDGGESGDCVHVSSADVNISGFTIKNAGNYGVYACSSNLNINNASISDCGKDAIHFSYGKSLTLRDSVLENCGGGLVYNDYSTAYARGNATVERNIIRNNTGSGLYIYLYGSGGIGDEAVINDNIITNNTGYGIKCDHYSSYYIDSITIRNNTVRNCSYDGVYVEGANDVNISDLIIENAGDDGVYARCYRNMTINPPFSIKNASGYGIYAYKPDFTLNNATIMDCGKDAIHFSYGKSLTLRDSVLENCGGGLTYHDYSTAYARGNATVERNIIRNNTGSGLYIYLYGSGGLGDEAVINDNIITNNTGYGIKCDHYSSYYIDSITMRNNTVRNCSYDGVYVEGATDVNITGLIIENAGDDGLYARCSRNMTINPPFSIKNASGYGIYAYKPDFTLNNATIMDCGKDAIHFSYGKSLTLRDSVLENCGGGLTYHDYSTAYATGNATIERNIIRNNTGSGLYIYLYGSGGLGDEAVINNNIITNNTGYGIKCDHYSSYNIDSITMRNNTVRNCSYDGVYVEGATDVNITGLIIENAGDDGLYARCSRNMTINPPFSIKNASGYGIYAYKPDFTLNNATIMDCGKDAIRFTEGKSLTLRDSILENCGGGLIYYHDYATGNAIIERNVIRDNTDDGLFIKLESGKSAVINDNMIINNIGSDSDGIYCYISGSGGLVTLQNNTVNSSGDDGIYLSGVKYSTLVNNTISLNSGYGIRLYSSNNNLIFHNNLINNSPNAYDSNPAINDWHHPILLEGNYWSDYTGVDDGSGTGKHAIAGDGIGDTNIPHPDASYDYYPFMNESRWTWPKLNITQAHTDKIAYTLNETVTISCVVQNETGVNISVDNVNAKIIKPDSSTEWITLFEGLTGNYNGIFTNTSLFGTYNVTIYATKIGYVPDTAKLSFGVLPEHDIAVTSIEAPEKVEINTTITVNGTICNLGLNNETGIVVDFIVDGVTEGNTTINITSGNCTNVSFVWIAPSVEGEHNLSIFAEYVAGEDIRWNNMKSQNITVKRIPDIEVKQKSFDFKVERGGVECRNLTIENKGTGVLIFNITIETRASASTTISTYQIPVAYKDTQIIFEQEFRKPDVEKIEIDKEEYDRVTIPGLPKIFKTGEPVLPVKNLQILLPWGKDVQSIEVKGEKYDLVGTYYVEPGEPPVPIGIPLNEPSKIIPNETVYSSKEPYPGLYEASVHGLRGYKILVMNLYPVQYTPKPGTISYYTKMEVVINTKPGANNLYRGLPKDRERAIQVVHNPEIADTYPLDTKFSPSYDHVIITNSSFASAFQQLADWKTRKGVKSHVVTVEYINSNFLGRDLQEKIRNYINYSYHNEGIEYVLLGGDADGRPVGGEAGPFVVPARGFYAEVGSTDDPNIPADLYYAALDGTWNDNNDTKWGEPGEDDLFAEVYVGRAPVDSNEEVEDFIKKTIAYEGIGDDPYLKNATMVGELLWTNPTTYGGDYKDEIKNGSCACNYCTVGFPADYNVSTLYDRDYPGGWPPSLLIKIMNSGTQLIFNHLGHANVGYVMKLYNSDVDALINDKYFFGYSQGCYDGSFDNRGTGGGYYTYDCIAEHFTVTPHGAFAFIGNSRYGWGRKGSTCGASQYYDRQFYDAIFGENITNIGKANQDSKEDNNGYINQSAMRWCYYELNLFGDPETSLIPTVGVSWLSVTPDNGTIDAGNYTNVSVCVNATYLNEGNYTGASIIIKNNDPDENPIEIPVNLTVVPPDHDIAVTNFSTPDEVEVNSNITVNATMCNLGSNDETDFIIDFIVNGIIEDNATIPSLTRGNCTNVCFNWTAPDVEGEHNLTIYAEPVINETIVWNNMVSKNISVITIADIWINPIEFDVTLNRGNTTNRTLTIGNNGTGLLEFEIRDRLDLPSILRNSPKTNFKNAIEPVSDAKPNANEIYPGGVNESSGAPLNFTDIHFVYNVESPSGDYQCLGVEFNGTHFFVTGGNRGSDPNKVYIFDRDGNYISSFNQVYSSGWGWRDLAWDGTYLYGSDDSYISQFLPNGTYIGDFPGPGVSPCRALAYDPATDHFWTANWDSSIYEFDRNGNIINQYSNSYAIYGMAWDDASPDGPWLWVFAQEGSPAVTAYQFDPINGVYTGVSFTGWGNPDDVAGGVCFTTEWDPTFGILVGLTQNVPDSIVGYEICLRDAPWLTERPTKENVTPSNHTNIIVSFNATELEKGEYNATIIIENNDPDENPVEVPVFLHVITPPHIISYSPVNLTPTQYVGTTYTFNVTTDQVMTSNWWFILPEGITTLGNGTSLLTITWKCAGVYNVTYIGTNENGSVNITWIVTVLEPPTIVDWYNNKTKDNSTSVTINISEEIYFNATANQSIGSWNWFKDGINQNNNYDNFSTSWSEKDEYTVSVNASNVNGTSNTVIWNVGVEPIASMHDLVITDTWVCSENCTICYNIMNIGNGTAPAGHNTTLYVDGVEAAIEYVDVALEPNESYIGCFKDYNWTYTPPSDNITVCADANNTVAESNETNNCMTNIWKCGDVNCDEAVDMSDVIDLLYYVGYPGQYTICNEWSADVNCDKAKDMSDVIDQQYYVGYPGQYELKCCCKISG